MTRDCKSCKYITCIGVCRRGLIDAIECVLGNLKFYERVESNNDKSGKKTGREK